MNETEQNIYFMRQALAAAGAAARIGEVPIGCVIVKDGEILASSHNLRETLQDVSAHAEMLAMKEANRKLHSWRLDDCVVYVTLEPCPMCAAALQQARVKKVYFAAPDPKAGAVISTDHFFDREKLNHYVAWEEGPLTEEAAAMLKSFFRGRRLANKALNRELGGRAARRRLMEKAGPEVKTQAPASQPEKPAAEPVFETPEN